MVSRRARLGGMEVRRRWLLPPGDREGREDIHMGTGADGCGGGIGGNEKGSDQASIIGAYFRLSSFVYWLVVEAFIQSG